MIFCVVEARCVAFTACATTCPTEYASATSAFTSDAVPPYFLTYSLTIALLVAFAEARVPGVRDHDAVRVRRADRLHERGALVRAGGRDEGLRVVVLLSKAWMNAETVGTSTEPRRTTWAFAAATASAIGV